MTDTENDIQSNSKQEDIRCVAGFFSFSPNVLIEKRLHTFKNSPACISQMCVI